MPIDETGINSNWLWNCTSWRRFTKYNAFQEYVETQIKSVYPSLKYTRKRNIFLKDCMVLKLQLRYTDTVHESGNLIKMLVKYNILC